VQEHPRVAGIFVERPAMEATTPTAKSGIDPIESGRFERACTQPMCVEFTGPGVADVTHDGATYEVELESGHCECDDYAHRGKRLICKHVQRAALSVLFNDDQWNTKVVGLVARYAAESGCQHGVRGCAGPTIEGERGLPCTGCCDAVRAPDVDEFTVWQRLGIGGNC
jgi:hypothetical protein